MSEDREYWKELLGDAFDEQIYEEIIAPSMDNEDKPAQSEKWTEIIPETPENAPSEAEPAPSGPVSPVSEEKFVDIISDTFKEKEPEYVERYDSRDRGGDRDYYDDDEYYEDDDEYYDDEEPVIRRSRRKKTGCLGGFMYAAFVIGLSLLIASLGWLAATDVLAFGKSEGLVTVTVPENVTVDGIADILYNADLINYKFLFKFYGKLAHADQKVSAGTYELNKKFDYNALIRGMTASAGERVTVDITIPEGYRMSQIFDLLEENNVCTAEELYDAAANGDFEYDFLAGTSKGDAQRLEGFLFPDTYTFYVDDSPSNALKKLLSNFNNKFTDSMYARAAELGYSPREIVTIASMIEKEAANDTERADVSSVIYNRLNSADFPRLQIDATVVYALGDGYKGGALTYDDTAIDSPYNTYVCEGLPIGPIANPGIASINAALYPNTTDYYYYALDISGSHSFFTNLNAFNAFLASDSYGG